MFEHDKRGKKTACRLAGKLHRLHKKRDKFPSVCVFVCVCDLHMYFALSFVSEIPHINRQLSIGHILFLPHLEKYQFHLCCCFPLPSPHFSPLCHLLPLSMLLSSGSARRWLSALPLLWLCGCDDDYDDDGVSRAYRGTALTYATHVCMCVSVAFVCAQLIYDISFIVIGQQLSTVLELSFCLCPLQCAHCLALSLPLSLSIFLCFSLPQPFLLPDKPLVACFVVAVLLLVVAAQAISKFLALISDSFRLPSPHPSLSFSVSVGHMEDVDKVKLT